MILIVLIGNFPFAPAAGLLVLLWVWLSATPWQEIGFAPPKSWPATVAVGVAFGVTFKFAMKAIVMPLLGADPINHPFHYLAGNRTALPAMIYAVVIGAGFGEEAVFRGFLFERFDKLFRSRIAAVALTSAWFGVAHYQLQGVSGVEQATIVGLAFGTIFAFSRTIWMLMVAHATFDLTAVAMIYWNVESRIAHLVFR